MSVQQKKMLVFLSVLVFLGIMISSFISKEKPASSPQEEKQAPSSESVREDKEVMIEGKENLYDQAQRNTKEDLQSTKKIATEFVRAFASFNGKNPSEHIEKAKPYMSEEMYENYKAQKERGTLTYDKVVPETLQTTEVSNDDPDVIQWNVIMQGKVYDVEGNSETEEDWYLVTLEKQDNGYKVVGVRVNLPN
ncbi:hypothetical protein [Priestia megaterium]|uniref:hypothetical protein n=1 Tax=Priestia megaterium TaxID=1404 RepID=UPI000BEE1AFB|nr:hypothetical protein [Priestia megaterium]MBV6738380.1 hypothetical protein [Priestia megaterium]PEC41845.1 hypothetical protein CON11_26325 [Priestia megaterium]